MTRSRYFILCVLVLAGTFGGSFMASRAVPVVHAQVMPIAGEVRGTSFTLMDSRGNTTATLRNRLQGAELTLNDNAGNLRIQLDATGGIVVRDQTGRVTWRSPKMGMMPASE